MLKIDGEEKTIQEILVEIESSREMLSKKEFEKQIETFGKPFAVLKEKIN